MRDYEELLRRVLRLVGEERREEIEGEVERRMMEDPRLTRLGALYVVAGELGVFERLEKGLSSVPLAKLVGGLGSVNIEARVIGLVKARREPPTIYLRLGDATGVVDAVAWGGAVSRLEELKVSVGGALYVKGAYTRERADGSVEVHLGEQAEFSEAGPGLPPFESFFRDLPDVLEARGIIDFKALLLGLADERSVSVKGEAVGVRDVLLGWRGVKAELSLWREQVSVVDEASVGRVAYVAGARWSAGGTLSTTSRTSIQLAGEEDREPLLVKVERGLNQSAVFLCFTNMGLERVYSEELKPGQLISVKRLRYARVGRSWALMPLEYEPLEGEAEIRPKFMKIGDLRVGMVDACVKGELASVSPATRIGTKRGEADFVSFWLRDGSASIYCKAWGEGVKMVKGLGEGEKVSLLFVRVVSNPWGEREVYIGEDSLVLPAGDSP
ncbi:MAG: hypothetical protein RMJ28_05015 [Nitrososphaerota archaeon]|nr:hypothetical protein [Candidatus Calditenuaceae archaeon]MDW8073581.1 hypothetical protein [Nitrososphaerota archaeon]